MRRDKNGRFTKNGNIEIPIPSLSFIAKYLLVLFILLPWFYLLTYKFEIIALLQESLFSIFGPKIINDSCQCEQKPY